MHPAGFQGARRKPVDRQMKAADGVCLLLYTSTGSTAILIVYSATFTLAVWHVSVSSCCWDASATARNMEEHIHGAHTPEVIQNPKRVPIIILFVIG